MRSRPGGLRCITSAWPSSVAFEQGVCKRSFAKVAGCWIMAGGLARRPVGQGSAPWAWPYPGTTARPSGLIPETNLPRSLAEIGAQSGANRWIRLSSAGRGQTSLIRIRQMTATRSISKLRSFGIAQVDLPRLNKTCHNSVRRLESLHESCSAPGV